ncbi:MAG: T9SS type A sorting domain-containing protein [Bacteroidetes bacterium]|nr:T9SS type A sorting domain-containing protein [Bacteroidota bacterium]
MKRSVIVVLVCAFIYIVGSSYSNGAAQYANLNCTGSYGSPNSCGGSGCHDTSNDANVVVNITVKDLATGNVINNSTIVPNAFYRIIVSGYKTGAYLPKASYQFTATSEFSFNGGTFTTVTNQHSTTVGQAIIVEPNSPINTTATGTLNAYTDSFYWQAPAQLSWGRVTMYATALVANGNFLPSGDYSNNYQRMFTPIPAGINDLNENTSISLYPNPVKDFVVLNLNHATHGDYVFSIRNSVGQEVYQATQQLVENNFISKINTENWTPGLYCLTVFKGNGRRSVPILKL